MTKYLPGMSPGPSQMEAAAEETITALKDAGLIGREHAATIQLIRELARTIAAGAQQAKTSVPQAAQQLMAALDSLPKPPETTADDALAAAMRGPSDGGEGQ